MRRLSLDTKERRFTENLTLDSCVKARKGGWDGDFQGRRRDVASLKEASIWAALTARALGNQAAGFCLIQVSKQPLH